MTSAHRENPMIPISSVVLPPEVPDRIARVLSSGQLAQGQEVAELEALAATMAGSQHAVAVSNGTVSLQLALQALQLGPGGEVLTSSFTFAGTINAILNAGLRVRFVDIDDRFGMDADHLESQIGPDTVAILPVHLYGAACDMTRICSIAERHGLAVVEDAAQAHGAEWHGQRVGSFGLGSFSLYATKNVTSGEGGIVTADDAQLANRLRLLRNQGMSGRYQFETVGTNARMTDVQAAIAIPQMTRLDEITDARQSNAALLDDGLRDVADIECPRVNPNARHVFHQYTVRVRADSQVTRDHLSESLARQNIATGIYYPRAAYDYEIYRSHPRVTIEAQPGAERAAREVLSLPVHPQLQPRDIERIVDAISATVTGT